MSFTLPQFNVSYDGWNYPNTPSGGGPDFSGIPCQFYVPSRGIFDVTPDTQSEWVPPIYIRVPVTSYAAFKAVWIFGVDDGHGIQYYKARWKEVMHLGFPNQYWIAVVEQCDNAGVVPFYKLVPHY
jgi:hypothetical protein